MDQDTERTRVQSDTKVGSVHTDRLNRDGSVRADPIDADVMILDWSSTIDDWNHPNYRKRVRSGEIINSPAEKLRYDRTWSIQPYSKEWRYRNDSTTGWKNVGTHSAYDRMRVYNGVDAPYTEPDYLWPSDSELQRLANLAVVDAKSRKADAEVDMGQNIGEYKQTLDLFSGAVKTVVHLTRVASGKQKFWKSLAGSKSSVKAAAAAKAARDAWLQYRYGVRPLISEVQGAIDAIVVMLQRRYTARSTRSSYDSEQTDEYTINNWGTSPSHLTQVDLRRSYGARVHVGEMYTFVHNFYDYATRFGYNNLFELSWEFIPYSFVVDWFFNVGNWLGAIAPTTGVKTLATWVTYSVESTTSMAMQLVEVDDYCHPDDYLSCTGGCVFTGRRTWWKRSNSCRIPYTPSLEVNLNLTKVVDAVALLSQLR